MICINIKLIPLMRYKKFCSAVILLSHTCNASLLVKQAVDQQLCEKIAVINVICLSQKSAKLYTSNQTATKIIKRYFHFC